MRTSVQGLSLCALLIAGCSGGAEPVTAEPVTAPQAQQAGNALSASAEESAGSYSEGGPIASFGGGCSTTATDDGVDADLDDVPDNGASVVVTNCSAEERGGVMNASYLVQDTLVEAGAAQFPFNFLVEGSFDVTAEGPDGTGQIAAGRTIEVFSDADSIGASDETSLEAQLTGVNGGVFRSDENRLWNTEYVQSMTSGTFGDGTLVMSGEWNIEFTFENDQAEYRAYANAMVHTEGLQLEADCPTHVVAGTLNAAYEAGESGGDDGIASIVVTWSGCGVSAATWDAEGTVPSS